MFIKKLKNNNKKVEKKIIVDLNNDDHNFYIKINFIYIFF